MLLQIDSSHEEPALFLVDCIVGVPVSSMSFAAMRNHLTTFPWLPLEIG